MTSWLHALRVGRRPVRNSHISRAYNMATRLPAAGWAALVAAVSAVQPAGDIGEADPALPHPVLPDQSRCGCQQSRFSSFSPH
jgi:hypothetical protein